MSDEQDMARRIAASCQTIAVLYETAVLITDRLANPHKDMAGHARTAGQASPIRLGDLDALAQADGWLRAALAAIGMPWEQACQAVQARPALAAATIAGHSGALASLPDGADWERDAAHWAGELERICHDTTPDQTAWRQARVPWRPSLIASLLTSITGRPVTAHRISQAAHDGRIRPADGRIALGQAADALRH